MIRTNKDALRLAAAHFNRMELAGVTATATQRAALLALANVMGGVGIEKWDAFYPFIGGTAAAHALDFMGGFDVTWGGSPTHDADGVTGNGSTAYGDTGFIPSSHAVNNDAHLGFYAEGGTFASGSTSFMGAGGGSAGFSSMFTNGWFDGGIREMFAISVSASAEYSPVTTETEHDGFLMMAVNGSRAQQYYRDGVPISSAVTATGGSAMSGNTVYLLGRHNAGGVEIPSAGSRKMKCATIGKHLSDSQALAFYNGVLEFQTALGRQI